MCLDKISSEYLASVARQEKNTAASLALQEEKVGAATDLLARTMEDMGLVLRASHEKLLFSIEDQQKQSLAELASQLLAGQAAQAESQQAGLDLFRQTQEKAIRDLADQQSRGVAELLDLFSASVSTSLAGYLEPVGERLTAAANVLTGAQVYARDVQETLQLQKEQSRVLEESIRDVLGQFVDTRQKMIADVASLENSTRVMSESAATMSAIYSGSQTGLNEAIGRMSAEMLALADALREVLTGSAKQAQLLQEQAGEAYEVNRQQLATVREQIDILTNDLATRIDQLMIGFTHLTEELVGNVQSSIDSQNDQLGSGLKTLTEIMAEEARSISLYAQGINMDISELNESLGQSVRDFASGIDLQLNNTLQRYDEEAADILRRLGVAASQIGDAVDALPQALQLKIDQLPEKEA